MPHILTQYKAYARISSPFIKQSSHQNTIYLATIFEGSHNTSSGKTININIPRMAKNMNGMVERYIFPMERPIGPAILFM